MPDETLLSDPQFPFTVWYPDPTPGGAAVIAHGRSSATGRRVHLISEGSDEVYFEIACYQGLPLQKAVEQFLAEVSDRLESLRHSEIIEIDWHGLPATRFSIDWPGRERVILFFEQAGKLYRIIYNPASPLNLAILASFEWRAQSR